MAEIPRNYGSGGAGLVPGGSGGNPELAVVLRDIAADLDDIQGAAPAAAAIVSNIASAALPAFTSPPTAPEMAALRTLVNEIRAVVIELRAVVVEARAAQTTRSGVTLRTVAV
jgi:hypothetical protein